MAVAYKPLFGIELLHHYFADRRCRVLALAPTAECRRLFERYRLLFRPTPDGGTVAYPEDPAIDFLALFNETDPFAFDLVCGDPRFGNYTALDGPAAGASPAETVFYFNNLEDQGGEVAGEPKRLLHPAGRAFVHGALPVRPKLSRLDCDPPLAGATVSVIDTLNRQTVRQWRTPATETKVFPLDLKDFPDGRYRLTLDGREPVTFYLSDVPAVRRWGIVEIYPGGPAMAGRVPEACRVLDPAGRPEPRTFTLCFDNRRTLWRYYVISTAPEERNYESYQVVGQDRPARNGIAEPGGHPFIRKPDPVDIQGRRAVVFESGQALPLWENPSDRHSFTLKPDGRPENGALSHALPYPQAGNTRLEEYAGERRMVSEMFVYL
jgi:hypothetical protein